MKETRVVHILLKCINYTIYQERYAFFLLYLSTNMTPVLYIRLFSLCTDDGEAVDAGTLCADAADVPEGCRPPVRSRAGGTATSHPAGARPATRHRGMCHIRNVVDNEEGVRVVTTTTDKKCVIIQQCNV